MKKILWITALVVILTSAANAQIGSFLNKVKGKVNQRVDSKVDKGIDRTLDKAEGKNTIEQKPAADQPTAIQPATTTAEEPFVRSLSKYDFIQGEKIVYYDNFEQDAIAELLTGWNTDGTDEVVTLSGFTGKWLRLHKNFSYFTSNEKELGENYTIEFDLVMQLKNNGWMYPIFSCIIFSSNGKAAAGNNFLREYAKNTAVMATIYPNEFKNTRVTLESFTDNKSSFRSAPKAFDELEKCYGKSVHIAIQVQKERFRAWINENKAFDVPRGVPLNYKMNQLLFKIGQTNYSEEQYGMYISNIKVAEGVPDTRHKLIIVHSGSPCRDVIAG